MDFAPLPTDNSFEPIEVPYVISDGDFPARTTDDFSGTYWTAFPKLFGYEGKIFWKPRGLHGDKAWSHMPFGRWLESLSSDHTNKLVQSWLYFGTLSEVTRTKLTPSKYTLSGRDGQPILRMTVEDLDELLDIFSGPVTPEEDPQSSAFFGTLQCLEMTNAILGFLQEKADQRIVLATSLLGETLSYALNGFLEEKYKSFTLRPDTRKAMQWYIPDFVHYINQLEQDRGWCKHRAPVERTLARRWYAVHLECPKDHHRCKQEQQCVAYQIEEETYRETHDPHLPAGHLCERTKSFTADAAQFLLSSPTAIPVVYGKMTQDKNFQYQMADSSQFDRGYVAISHVWSDGLGNPKDNSLQACQLHRINSYLQAISREDLELSPTNGAGVPFWIDTLSCPVAPANARKMAIVRMGQTYKAAKHVLVLDGYLCHLKAESMAPLEILQRIYKSAWMTRLWTLQEGQFAKRLWFQFADKPISLESVQESDYLSAVRQNSITRGTLNRIFNFDLDLSYRSIMEIPYERLGFPLVSRLIHMAYSLWGRSTTRAADEPLCIGTLLQLDVKQILEASDTHCDARMQVLWDLLGEVPPSIIFVQTKRLERTGYRWAPTSLMREPVFMPLSEKLLSNVGTSKVGTLDPSRRGLFVQFPGFRIADQSNCFPIISILAKDHEKYRAEGFDYYWIRSKSTASSPDWFHVAVGKPVHGVMPDDCSECAMICFGTYETDGRNEAMLSDPRRQALLVEVTNERQGEIFCRSICHLSLMQVPLHLSVVLELAYTLRQMYAMAQDKLPYRGLLLLRDMVLIQGMKSPHFKEAMDQSFSYLPRWVSFRNKQKERMRAIGLEFDPSAPATWVFPSEDPSFAREVQEDDWEFRMQQGDANILVTWVINVWMNHTSAATAVPKDQIWCVD